MACKTSNTFFRVFGYVNDGSLISPTFFGQQEMLNLCEDFVKDYKLLFNVPKKHDVFWKRSS